MYALRCRGTRDCNCSKCVADDDSELFHLAEMISSFQLDLSRSFSFLATGIDIRQLDRHSQRRSIIKEYFQNSQSDRYSDLRIEQIWRVHFAGPHPPFKYSDYYGDDTMLLWHGTSRKNLTSILKHGLKLPVIPEHDNWFGRGIYLADRMATSADFIDKHGPRVFLLCEAALGRKFRLNDYQDLTSPPRGFDSAKVVGRKVPDSHGDRMIWDNCTVPCGKTVRHRDRRMQESKAPYNEYVVFDPDRIRIKFILHVVRRN